VVQTANPTGWKWTVYVPGKRTAPNRLGAIRYAESAIDKAIKVGACEAANEAVKATGTAASCQGKRPSRGGGPQRPVACGK
jgi:hypothetical protein